MRSFLSLLVVALLVVFPLPLRAMTSTNYQIDFDAFGSGGDDQSSSDNYSLQDTIGGFAVGTGTSTSYLLSAGYRTVNDTVHSTSFQLLTQTSASQVAYSNLSTSPAYVTVTSVSGFSVDDYIFVIENQGFSQKIAVGKISSVDNVNTRLYVDSWSGDSVNMQASVSGGNDFVYLVSGSGLSFGTVTRGAENTSSVLLVTNVTSDDGYTMYVEPASDLQTSGGGHAIPAVSDGGVSVGSEEYGVRAVGSYALHPSEDVGLTAGSATSVFSSIDAATSGGDRGILTHKLSVTDNTAAGDYSQDVYYRVVANF